jgi:hypothetical protein
MTMFVNGVDGYTGTFDRRISENSAREVDGSTVTNYLIDGYAAGSSPDEQNLIRFDDIIGNGPGQIPPNALILDATLQIRTSDSSTADSPGPWGVARLLQPFSSATSYFNDFTCNCPLVSRGAWWQDGYTARPDGGFDRTVQGDIELADVRDIVQDWADGEANHGMVMQAGFTGTTNGWNFWTTGVGDPTYRPKLSVTYTTDPVAINTFQQDVNGYTGTTMARVASGDIQSSSTTNPDPTVDDITYDGYTGVPTVSPTSTIDPPPTTLTDFQIFLDGPTPGAEPGTLGSNDQIALLKFSDVFGSGGGQAPADKAVAKAWLVLTTGDTSNNARSNGTWAAHTMLRDWDTTTLYSDIGATPGLQEADGDISAAIGTAYGMITGSEVWFDVTSYLEGVRNGATDYGIAVQSFNTSDGWQIHLTGTSDMTLRPQLVVVSDLSSVGLAGDYNGDGSVDAADYVVWRKDPASFGGDPDGYNTWQANFGNSSGAGSSLAAGAVPEPGSIVLITVAMLMSPLVRRKRCLV